MTIRLFFVGIRALLRVLSWSAESIRLAAKSIQDWYSKEKPFRFKQPESLIRALGIDLHLIWHTKQNDNYNFKEELQEIGTVHGIWKSRNLTLFGRCLITKSLAILQLVHPISILDIPKDYITVTDSEIVKFIWKKRRVISSVKGGSRILARGSAHANGNAQEVQSLYARECIKHAFKRDRAVLW